MTTSQLPGVTDCSVTGCSFNHDGCHAHAITVRDTATGAGCGTFISLNAKGGLDTVHAQVGACQRVDCSFNASLECTAKEIRIGAGSDLANCLTYAAA